MRNYKLLASLILGISMLPACGGGSSSGSSESNTTQKPQQDVDSNNNSSNDGFTALEGNKSSFPDCKVVANSTAPSYLNCLSGNYKGKNPAGDDCSIEFDGKTFDGKFVVGNTTYTLFGSEKSRTLYSRTDNYGHLALLMAFVNYEKNDDSNYVASRTGELKFTFSPDPDLGNTIDLSVDDRVNSNNNAELSCLIEKVKLN